MPIKHKPHIIHWHKEVALFVLALIGIGLFLYEVIAKPSHEVVSKIVIYDTIVALVFLIDFIFLYKKSRQKDYFLKHNWYLLLASVPAPLSFFGLARGIRIVRFIRLISIGEHLEFSYAQSRQKKR